MNLNQQPRKGTRSMYGLDRESCEAVVKRAATWGFSYCKRNGLHYLITPSSGGRDSAITLGINQRVCQLAAQKKYSLTSVGVAMPCHTPKKITRLGQLAIKTFGAEELEPVDLSIDFDELMEYFLNDERYGLSHGIKEILRKKNDRAGLANWKNNSQVAQGNIKARLRMITAYHIARMFGSGVVVGTDNLSEFWMGFWTLHGDVGDIGYIQNILKGLELEAIAEYLGVPKKILDEEPSDGLGVKKGGDAAQLGADYPLIDATMVDLLQQKFNPDGHKKQLCNLPSPRIQPADPKLALSLATRAIGNSFKRRGPAYPSRKQLGLLPIEAIKL
ncbi:MAG: NAD(+) synthase [Candidatus Buchananbacteria bacterium]